LISGNSNITVGVAGNIIIAANGVSNIAFFTDKGLLANGALSPAMEVNGFIRAFGNVTAANIRALGGGTGSGIPGTVLATGNITGDNLIASSGVSAPTITTNNIVSDDSTFVTVQDGLNVNGDVDIDGVLFATGNITGDNILTSGIINTGVYNIGNIPSASNVGIGSRAFVTDADSVTFGATYVGGAANNMPVFSNGTNWYIG
jgi:hypothetical protein